jgi:hypothetical protein
MGFSCNTPHSDVVLKFQPGITLYVHNLEFSVDSTSRFALVDGVMDEEGNIKTLENPVWVSMSSNNLDFVRRVEKCEVVNYDGSHSHGYRASKYFDF